MTTAARHLRKALIKTHPHDSDLDEDKLLGTVTNLSIPRGHSDGLHHPLPFPPGEDDL